MYNATAKLVKNNVKRKNNNLISLKQNPLFNNMLGEFLD